MSRNALLRKKVQVSMGYVVCRHQREILVFMRLDIYSHKMNCKSQKPLTDCNKWRTWNLLWHFGRTIVFCVMLEVGSSYFARNPSKWFFFDNCRNSHAHWLNVIVNTRTYTWVCNLCDASASKIEQFDNFILEKTNWCQFFMCLSCYWRWILS